MAGSFGGAMGPGWRAEWGVPHGKIHLKHPVKWWQLTPQRSRWSISGSEVWHSFTMFHVLSILLPIWSNRLMLEAGCGNKLGFFWILLLQECKYFGPTSQKPCSERYSWWPINLRALPPPKFRAFHAWARCSVTCRDPKPSLCFLRTQCAVATFDTSRCSVVQLACGSFLKWWVPSNDPKLDYLTIQTHCFSLSDFRKPPCSKCLWPFFLRNAQV